MKDKTTAYGYTIVKEDIVGGITYFLALKTHDDHVIHYYSGTIDKRLQSVGVEQICADFESTDYIETVTHYYEILAIKTREVAQQEKEKPREIIYQEQCLPVTQFSSLKGQIVVLQPDILYPEFQSISHQLYLADGGNGCNPNGRGTAIFGYNLYSGEHERIENYEILGVIKKEYLPNWAKKKSELLINQLQKNRDQER